MAHPLTYLRFLIEMTANSKQHAIACFLVTVFACTATNAQGDAIWEGVYTAEQAARGESVYSSACIACHGQDLGGNSNSPGLTGMGFMFLWEGRTLGAFFEQLSEQMPTDRPGQLPQQDYLDVVAYILQKNGFPQGSEEISPEIEILNNITIAPKP